VTRPTTQATLQGVRTWSSKAISVMSLLSVSRPSTGKATEGRRQCAAASGFLPVKHQARAWPGGPADFRRRARNGLILESCYYLHPTMTTGAQSPEFDAGNWVKMARFAVAAGAVLSAVTAAILLIVDPPKQCPSWTPPRGNPLWEIWATFVPVFLVPACFIAFRWNWVARRAAKHRGRKMLFETLFGPRTPPAIPVTYFMVNFCVAASLASQFPLFALIVQCTDWLRL